MKYLILAAIFICVGCSGSYFKVNDTAFQTSDNVAADAAAVTQTLIDMGYDIEEANQQVVKTKPEQFYYARGRMYETELQSWITVDLKKGSIKSYCTERRMYSHNEEMVLEYDKNWRFTPCKNPHVIERIRITTEALEQSLKVT